MGMTLDWWNAAREIGRRHTMTGLIIDGLDELSEEPEPRRASGMEKVMLDAIRSDWQSVLREDMMEISDDPDGEKLSTWISTHKEDFEGSCRYASLYVDSVLADDAEGFVE